MLPIQGDFTIQQVDLQVRLDAVADRRAHAHIGDTGGSCKTCAADLNRIHPRQRRPQSVQLQVRGGCAQGLAQLATVDHLARDRIGTTQQALRLGKIGTFQRFAYPGTAHPLRTYRKGRCRPRLIAIARTLLPYELQVTFAIIAKAEIITQYHVAHPQAGDKNIIQELLGRHGAQAFVEPHTQQTVDPQSSHGEEFFPEAHDPGRRLERGEILPRQRLEYHHQRRHSQLTGFVLQMPDYRLVAQMHAIKGTDRNHAVAVSGPQIVQAADQFHRVRSYSVRPNAQV